MNSRFPTPALSGSGSMVLELNYSISAGKTQRPYQLRMYCITTLSVCQGENNKPRLLSLHSVLEQFGRMPSSYALHNVLQRTITLRFKRWGSYKVCSEFQISLSQKIFRQPVHSCLEMLYCRYLLLTGGSDYGQRKNGISCRHHYAAHKFLFCYSKRFYPRRNQRTQIL